MLINVMCDLESLKVSPTARWARHGTTIAGAANGEGGSTLDKLNWNFGIYCDDDDILYIADAGNNRIVLIAPNSTTVKSVIGGNSQSAMLKLNSPTDVFVTRTSIYITDSDSYRVQRWSKDLSNVVTIAGIFNEEGDSTSMTTFSIAFHLFIDNYGNVFVSDYNNNRVMKFPWSSTSGTSGVIVAGTGFKGFNSTQLDSPLGIFVTDDGMLYIADRYNNRIQKWILGQTSGVTVAGTGVAGRRLSQLYDPFSVLVDLNGCMYITDCGNDRIMRWAPNAVVGECIVGCSGYSGIDSSQLNRPSSLAIDSSGSLYINDWMNNRVQKFEIVLETGRLLIDYLSSISVRCFSGQTTTSIQSTTSQTASSTSKFQFLLIVECTGSNIITGTLFSAQTIIFHQLYLIRVKVSLDRKETLQVMMKLKIEFYII